MLVLAAAFGFLGGSVSTRLQSVAAATGEVLRTTRVEFVDASGLCRAILGVDSNNRKVLLSFISKDGKTAASLGLASDDLPFLDLNGTDGKTRATLRLSEKSRPLFSMGDETWEGRIMLGAIENDFRSTSRTDWGLQFTGPSPMRLPASIGMIWDSASNSFSGTLTVHDVRGKVLKAP